MWWCPSEEQQHPDKPWHPPAAAHSAEIYQPTALYRKYHGKVKPGIYRQLSPQCYIHLIKQGGLGKWEGSVWSLLSSKDITKDHHFIPGMALLRYRSTVKIKSHHWRALLPYFPAVPSLSLLVFYMPWPPDFV